MIMMGQVVSAYGVHGWIRIRSFSEEADALLGYPTWWLHSQKSDGWREVSARGGRMHSGDLIASVAGIDSREAAQELRGSRIAVARAALAPAGEGEVYLADLVGLAVMNRDGVGLGRVAEIRDFGAHPLLVVVGAGEQPEAPRLIPYVPVVIDRVDLEGGRIEVDWDGGY